MERFSNRSSKNNNKETGASARMAIIFRVSSLIQVASCYGNMREVISFFQSINRCRIVFVHCWKRIKYKIAIPSIPHYISRFRQHGKYFLPTSRNIMWYTVFFIRTSKFWPSLIVLNVLKLFFFLEVLIGTTTVRNNF